MWEVWGDGEIGHQISNWRGFLPSRLQEDNTFARGLVKLHPLNQLTFNQLTYPTGTPKANNIFELRIKN
ncbi:MAG: hypothetical protein F6J90_22465 [Moorea sp. SIOASIH]|uniref:hypothetical protein n=1 Tax=Moorena sp. SIOASIH TaxID=2607817 RepID=UPI0013BB5C86|nr:hypothetical protein [Moorena sp. SIOASIH]NEO38946.1 hypothetical protein [Moorena sp. SIOASIH]